MILRARRVDTRRRVVELVVQQETAGAGVDATRIDQGKSRDGKTSLYMNRSWSHNQDLPSKHIVIVTELIYRLSSSLARPVPRRSDL
jgi:hypothetical protein